MVVWRTDKFMAQEEAKSLGVFGAVNVGDDALWWDYGQLRLYRTNNRLLTSVRIFAVLILTGFDFRFNCVFMWVFPFLV